MTKKNNKSALLTSVIALILCFAMLAGTTFAWFTADVKSGRNVISSGNLAVDLYYATYEDYKSGTWHKVDENVDVFSDQSRWEPGYTELVYFKVENAGELALKYDFDVTVYEELDGINVYNNPFKLSDFLWTYAFSETEANAITSRATCRENGAKTGGVKLLSFKDQVQNNAVVNDKVVLPAIGKDGQAADNDYVFAVAVWMPEETDNNANHNGTDKPSIKLGVNLVATQYTYEEDTFDENYDTNAQYPTAP